MWDERFSQPGFAYGQEPNDFLVAWAHEIPQGPVLSLAEGEGRNAVFLARRGFRVNAVDQSGVGLDKAAQLAARHGVKLELIQHDLSTYELGQETYSGLVSIFCHLPPEAMESLHHRCVQALKPGGVLILEGFSVRQGKYGSGGPHDAACRFTTEMMRTQLAGLHMQICRQVDRRLQEGRHHQGLASVIQVLARKPRT